MSISPARAAAFEVLLRIETERAFSSILLPIYEERLEQRDRGLCHELTLGVLRHQIRLDRTIDTLAKKTDLDPEVRIALRLGLYQLLYLDRVPAHSAVNESVDLVKISRKRSASGMVNAILRRVTRDGAPEITFEDDLERISIETSHPRPLLERWIKMLGADRTAALAHANNMVPAVCFRVLRPSGSLEKVIVEGSPSEHVAGAYLSSDGPAIRGLVENRSIYVQDEGSQMIGATAAANPGGRALDVCAAPGGKTGQIAGFAADRVVVGGDIYESRARLLKDNCEYQGVNVSVLCYDAAFGLPFADESFDTVLVDAPCSGTGTIRHNPELRYQAAIRDLGRLQSEQLAIVRNASKVVRRGGTLLYSTCSLEREEDEDVCARFLAGNAEFSLKKPGVPAEFWTPEGFARTWPDRDGMDGFFLAEFSRRA